MSAEQCKSDLGFLLQRQEYYLRQNNWRGAALVAQDFVNYCERQQRDEESAAANAQLRVLQNPYPCGRW